MKKVVLLMVVSLVALFVACEENDVWEGEMDASTIQQALTEAPECVRYVDTQAVPGGDGLSWETAVVSVEDALELEVEEVDAEEPCEVWVKGAVESSQQLAEIVPKDTNIRVFDGFAGGETARISRKSPAFSTVPADRPMHVASSVVGELVKSDDSTGNESVTVDRSALRIDNYLEGLTLANTPEVTPYATYHENIYIDMPSPELHLRDTTDDDDFAIRFEKYRSSTTTLYYSIDGYQDDFRFVSHQGRDFYLAGGDVGIHTNSASSALHIHDTTNMPSSPSISSNVALKIANGGSQAMLFDSNQIESVGDRLYLNHRGSGSGNDVIMAYGGGNVGIGTMSPTQKLEVNGTVKATHFLAEHYIFADVLIADSLVVDDDTIFVGDDTHRVGIGTNSPDYKLDVNGDIKANGTIRAEEIIVAAQPADFVFEEEYCLMPLEEVATFIDENGHLPDIPSAEQEAANGTSLAERSQSLLQKVEELTLHLIAQNKKIVEQERELSSVREEISVLKNAVSNR